MRCTSTYGGAVTLRGRPIRCELPIGHAGDHGHSFAARYWRNVEDAGTLARLARVRELRPSIVGGVKIA